MNKIILQHIAGASPGREQAFPAAFYRSLLIGRDPICEIDFIENRRVSRSHALVEWDDAAGVGLRIRDLESTNGTYVNGAPVEGTVTLAPGDAIRLGRRGPELRIAVAAAGRERLMPVTDFRPLAAPETAYARSPE